MITTSNKCYNKFNYLKESFEYNFYKNIKIKYILIWEFITLTYNYDEFIKLTWRKIISSLFKSINFRQLKEVSINYEILLTNTIKRKDYLETTNFISQSLDKATFLPIYQLPRIRVLKPINLFRSIKMIFTNNHLKVLNFKEKVYLTCRTSYYLNLIDNIDYHFKALNQLKLKKYVAFNSSFWEETIITQYLNSKGVETYSLSHGLTYVDYLNEKPMDATAGGNITAKNIFVWGSTSVNDLIKNHQFNPNRIIIGGNIKYPDKNIQLKNTFKNCIVLLGRSVFDEGNFQIINILNEVCKNNTHIRFSIKLHPSLNYELYEKQIMNTQLQLLKNTKTVKDYFESEEFDFAISYNTTAYYEALYHNLICFRYSIGQVENYIGLDDKFEKATDLLDKIDNFKKSDIIKYSTEVKLLLTKTIGMGINNYKSFLDT